MRSSPLPWGNWSAKQVLFNPFADEGYEHFIHLPGHDNITDPLRENEIGGSYGPYIIDKFTTGNGQTSTIYFTLSTWNPYTTVLMQAQLKRSQQQIPEFPSILPTMLLCFVLLAVALCARHHKTVKRDQPSKTNASLRVDRAGFEPIRVQAALESSKFWSPVLN